VEDGAVFLRQSRSGQQPGKLHEDRCVAKLDTDAVYTRMVWRGEAWGRGQDWATMAGGAECISTSIVVMEWWG